MQGYEQASGFKMPDKGTLGIDRQQVARFNCLFLSCLSVVCGWLVSSLMQLKRCFTHNSQEKFAQYGEVGLKQLQQLFACYENFTFQLFYTLPHLIRVYLNLYE